MIQEITTRSLSGKKILSILILAVCLLISGSLLAQGVPQGISYQAVVRDASGEVIPDTPVELKMSIKVGNVTIYQELHATSTNGFGLVTVNIGMGQVLLGDFSSIDWAADLHFLFVEVSVDGGPFVNMGISRLLSVPYAFVAQKAVEGDADADPANELQTLSQSGTNVTLSNGGGTISIVDNDNDPANELQDISIAGHELSLSNGSTLTLPDDVDDADADPVNELQDISIVGHDLSLSNGSTLTLPDNVDDADADPVNELQTLSQTGTDVTLSNGGGTISVADDDNDPDNELQDISIVGHDLSLSNGSTLTLPDDVDDADADPVNELQTLSQAGTDVTLSNGGGTISVADDDNDSANELQDWSNLPGIPAGFIDGVDNVDDADADPVNELQTMSQTGTDVTLSNGGGTISVADDDNDSANELQDWGNLPGIPAGFIDGVDNVDDADADPVNELQTMSQTGTDVTLSNGGGTISVADDDNDPANELQDWGNLPGIPAGFIDGVDNVDDADADPVNELQDISIVGHDLSLSNGSTLTLPDEVDDADADPVNELQSLSQIGTDVTLSNGGGTISVDDDDDDPDNELQYLTQAGAIVTLSNGGGSISVADDDDDPANELQALSLNGNILELSNGNSVVLPLIPIPVGTIVPFAGELLPAGWLLCDGSTRGRLNFANLFGVIGEKWGEGDGLNTFNLPDLRGQFLRGRDTGTGQDPDAGSRTAKYTGGATGDNVGSYQGEAFKSHKHNANPHNHGAGGYKSTGGHGQAFESAGAVDRQINTYNSTVIIQHTGGNETRPKNAYVLYIIKY